MRSLPALPDKLLGAQRLSRPHDASCALSPGCAVRPTAARPSNRRNKSRGRRADRPTATCSVFHGTCKNGTLMVKRCRGTSWPGSYRESHSYWRTLSPGSRARSSHPRASPALDQARRALHLLRPRCEETGDSLDSTGGLRCRSLCLLQASGRCLCKEQKNDE
jgi:hypothetical protein